MANKFYEESNIQAIADSIRAKNKKTDKYKVSDMSAAIDAIEVNDTSGDTATADDIAEGKTAHTQSGQVTGTVVHENATVIPDESANPTEHLSYIGITYPSTGKKRIIGDGARLTLEAPKRNFGNAEASDVVSGKTFTSTAGLKIAGTHVCSGGSGGIDTSDATATASDMKEGTTAYVNGAKVTGTLKETSSATVLSGGTVSDYDDDEFRITGKINSPSKLPAILKSGSSANIYAYKTEFGDATAEDVAQGKTFTSTAGLKVTGTVNELGGSALVVESAYQANDPTFGKRPDGATGKAVITGYTRSGDALIRDGYTTDLFIPAEKFGDATESDVISGKTFTSTSGLKLTGTHVCSGGIDTSDATATSSDIAKGSTAYVNGVKITGNVPVKESGDYALFPQSNCTVAQDPYYDDLLEISGEKTTDDVLLRKGSFAHLYLRKYDFGYATADKVLKGNTFTSEAGFKIVGTMTDNGAVSETLDTGTTSYTIQKGYHNGKGTVSISKESKTATPSKAKQTVMPSSGKVLSSVVVNAIPSNYVDTSDADATAANIQSGRTAYVNGVKVTGTHTEDTGLDTSDATATADDMAEGVTAYVNGARITGTITNEDATIIPDESANPTEHLSYIGITYPATGVKRIIGGGVRLTLEAPKRNLGDAETSDVVSGKTFTSSAGLKVTGTHVCPTPSGTLEITENGTHDVTNYASANVNVPSTGIDTSDATATASDMKEGVTAYVNGEKVTGTLPHLTQNINISSDPSASGSNVQIKAYASTGTKRIIGDGAALNALVPLSKFGDATAEDVVSGKTFTSTAGLKVTGTHTCSGLDTSDATATASDMADGVTAYVNGEKVTGNVTTKTDGTSYPFSGSSYAPSYVSSTSKIRLTAKYSNDTLMRTGSQVVINSDSSNFGDATADDVVSGKTFTSSAGVKVTGTHICSGIDTSDATASASDILSGKTAYVNGSKVTGNIASQAAQTITPGTSDKTIASGKYLSGTQTIKGDANLVAGNIKSGVSIFGVTGSYEGSGGGTGTSGNNCEAYVVDATNPVVNFTRTDGTIKVFGEAIGTSSGYQTPFYAFCGDGYYKASSYGSPSKTSVTWSIDASGKLSGLPSNIASGKIIVTRGV